MSLAEKLAEPISDKGGRSCALCRLLEDLDGEDRDALDTALRRDSKEGGWSARALSAALRDEGHEDVKKSTVENHRREHLS